MIHPKLQTKEMIRNLLPKKKEIEKKVLKKMLNLKSQKKFLDAKGKG